MAGHESLSGARAGAVSFLQVFVWISFAVWSVWSTIIAFFGGHIPLLPLEFRRFSVLRGLVWLAVADTLGAVAAGVILTVLTALILGPKGLSSRGASG